MINNRAERMLIKNNSTHIIMTIIGPLNPLSFSFHLGKASLLTVARLVCLKVSLGDVPGKIEEIGAAGGK
jgi:hypothetical protein